MTDAGAAYMKGMGNPAGDIALASEIVAGELAHVLGLRVPRFAIVELDLDVPMDGHGNMTQGPCFVSSALPGAVGDAAGVFLRDLRDPHDAALLVIFDTLVRNFDRCPPGEIEYGEPNRDNLFFTPAGSKYDLVALDHSHCFMEGELDPGVADADVVRDARLFGLFPEFAPLIDEVSVIAAVDRLDRIDRGVAEAVVHSIPRLWGPSMGARASWAEFITERARFVAEAIPGLLLNQVRLAI